jgi:hypothetical protein
MQFQLPSTYDEREAGPVLCCAGNTKEKALVTIEGFGGNFMQSHESWMEERAQLHDKMDRHDRQRKSDLWAARVLNVLVIAGLLFVAYVCFITRHDLVRAFLDTWRSL